MSTRIHSPLKWHGGKSYLASKIVAMMPPHVHYVEPFAGGLSVLLAKEPEGVSEVVNDLNEHLACFWDVMVSPKLFEKFVRMIEGTPFSEERFDMAGDPTIDSESPTSRAYWFFIRCRQSLAGRMDTFAPLSRNRTRGGMNEQASAWLSAVEGLPAVHARLKRVVILNRDALDVIRQQDGPQTLFYLDPPYLHETRTAKDAYEHEMTERQHEELLRVLAKLKGKFLLSGYQSNLYSLHAGENRWHRTDFDLPNNSAGGKAKRRMIECVWTNFKPVAVGTTNETPERKDG